MQVSQFLIIQLTQLWFITEVLSLMSKSSCKFMHHFFENNTVNVLTQHVEQEPISHFALLDDCVDNLTLDEAKPDVKEVSSHSRTYDYHEAVDNH